MASFKLAGDDYEAPTGDDNEGIACDATVCTFFSLQVLLHLLTSSTDIRVTEYSVSGSNVNTVRGERVPIMLGCPAGTQTSTSSSDNNNDNEDDGEDD